MDLRVRAFHMLILVSGLCLLQARGGSSNSVLFLDGSEHKYIRSHPETVDEANPMSPLEVAATVSVLLGVAPPVSLPAESSLKLDKILTPNPFSRPRAVVMLEVQGIGDLSSALHSILQDDSALSGKIISSGNAHIELFGDDEVSQTSIDEPIECDSACAGREFSNLARWLGGSYVGSMESQDGELEFPLASGTSLNLHVSKEADRTFALSLVSLFNGVKTAMEMQEDFEAINQRPVDLFTGCFTGIKLFHMALARLFGSLQKTYQGEVVGVILLNEQTSASSMEPMLDVKLSPRASRWLQERPAANTTNAEVHLVRTTLAWITGIILLLSTLIGVYYLLYMPFNRDTLLYSNVKLD
ncbi:unnamed protein product [Spirodela intermedia]|uniref:DUF7794 domain-containing protein n=1 Tax=Spirodela intermedia TaxID=51605 RepID=A0A7I8IWY3_SPIIN|nr:unnamed protein product [Spirodela intermedia]CAA6662505.1 unnamed protein product [Spirodela intermedia]